MFGFVICLKTRCVTTTVTLVLCQVSSVSNKVSQSSSGNVTIAAIPLLWRKDELDLRHFVSVSVSPLFCRRRTTHAFFLVECARRLPGQWNVWACGFGIWIWLQSCPLNSNVFFVSWCFSIGQLFVLCIVEMGYILELNSCCVGFKIGPFEFSGCHCGVVRSRQCPRTSPWHRVQMTSCRISCLFVIVWELCGFLAQYQFLNLSAAQVPACCPRSVVGAGEGPQWDRFHLKQNVKF